MGHGPTSTLCIPYVVSLVCACIHERSMRHADPSHPLSPSKPLDHQPKQNNAHPTIAIMQVSPRKCEIVFDYFLEEQCVQEKIAHGQKDHAALEQ